MGSCICHARPLHRIPKVAGEWLICPQLCNTYSVLRSRTSFPPSSWESAVESLHYRAPDPEMRGAHTELSASRVIRELPTHNRVPGCWEPPVRNFRGLVGGAISISLVRFMHNGPARHLLHPLSLLPFALFSQSPPSYRTA